MKPLFEAIPLTILEKQEVTKDGQTRLRVRGVFHRADERNANNRIYPKAILERETRKMRDRIAKGESIYMQADHPTDGTSRIGDTTAILRNATFDPATNEVMGEAEIITTHKGNDLIQLINAGGGVGVSARGFGTTKPGEWAGNKGEIVQEDYQLLTYDFVVGQSTRGAIVSNFMEQARAQAGLAEGEQMDLKTLDVEQLTAARPDLIKAVTDAATKSAKEEAKKEVNALLAEKTKEIEANIRKEVEEAAKKKADAEDAADDGDDEDEEDANGNKKKAKGKNEQDTPEVKKLKEEAKKHGLTLVPKAKPTEKMEGELATMRTQLTEAMNVVKGLQEQTGKILEQQQQVEVSKYVFEKAKDEKRFKNPLIERLLKECKSREEVDAKFEGTKADIHRLLSEASGNGATSKEEEPGTNGTEKTLKAKNGKVFTEQEVYQRALSGIKTELVEQEQ